MAQQFFFGAVVSAKVFVVWHKTVDGGVAFPAKRDRLGHLISRESFLEPFVRMALPGNQVVLGRPNPRLTPA